MMNLLLSNVCDVCSRGRNEAAAGDKRTAEQEDQSCFSYSLSEPVYILELGAGHGKFSFLLLQALLESVQFIPTLDSSFVDR